MYVNRKLKHYYVTGVLIEPGQYVDRFGHHVQFTPKDNFDVEDVVPIYYEHGGPIVGFATRFYTSNNKLCFDGYVFDPLIMEVLMSSHPGVSAELIKTSKGWVITGLALTKHPAIENARIQGVIAMSSIKKELKAFLEDNGIKDAEKIAALVEKFLAQYKYPSPELKQYEIKLSEAARTIESLNEQIEELKTQNEEYIRQIEQLKKENHELSKKLKEKEKKCTELSKKCIELEQEMKKREYMQKIRELEEKVKKMVPDIDLSVLPEDYDYESRIKFLESLLVLLSKKEIAKKLTGDKKEKLEFSVSNDADADTESDLDVWEAAINMYVNK